MLLQDNPHFSFAFYNLENLFDPEQTKYTHDPDFTPEGIYAWDINKYHNKIHNLGFAISKIGHEHSQYPPLLIGVCEVENKRCLYDLIKSQPLADFNYDFVHFDSPDPRGLGTALLYQKKFFQHVNSKPYTICLEKGPGKEKTRDILYSKGTIFSETLHILVNHWPSRLDGIRATQYKRHATATKLKKIVNEIYNKDPKSKILILGDFNDNPGVSSLEKKLGHAFFNPLGNIKGNHLGSARYNGKWVLFDQILMNKNLLEAEKFIYKDSIIYNPEFLIQKTGRHKGSPKRSYIGRYHLGGYSDHFPVYSLFQIINEETL